MPTATYSPDDDRLRLRVSEPLDSATVARLRGFVHVPEEGLYVSPRWWPEAEDVLVELCGEVGDEDGPLGAWASEYAERRTSRGGGSGGPSAVKPERRWETRAYWVARARGALLHRRHRQRRVVRLSRIRRLEDRVRASRRWKARMEHLLVLWLARDLTLPRARDLADQCYDSFRFPLARYPRARPACQHEGEMGLQAALDGGILTPRQARDLAVPLYRAAVVRAHRTITRLEHRLAYERALLAGEPGPAATLPKPEPGGACRCPASPPGGWSLIRSVRWTSVGVRTPGGPAGPPRSRVVPLYRIAETMSRDEVDAARAEGRLAETPDGAGFHLTSVRTPAAAHARPSTRAAA